MTEEEREAFLQKFSPERTAERDTSLVAFCVMGGLFSEGIDLTGDRLIGVIVVGTGLPMVCTEQKILQGYFEEEGKDGRRDPAVFLVAGGGKVVLSGAVEGGAGDHRIPP